MRHISTIFLSCLTMSSFGSSNSIAADGKLHMAMEPLAVLCGKSAEVLKAFVDKDSEIVLKGIDVVGGIFMAVRSKNGMTVFLTSPIESQGKALCVITAIKQPNMKVEKHFGKPTGVES